MAPSHDPPHPGSRIGGPDFAFESQAIAAGFHPVAGVDEVGRGPLAGPVVVAAVILDPAKVPAGLNDSKKLDRARRDALFEEIFATAQGVTVASVCAEAIDRGNIRLATLEAMRRAVLGLCLRPGFVLVDGRDVPPGLPCSAKALIGGDGRSQSIAAASIVAKVLRDRVMAGCGEADPRFGFASHVGYGTAEHRRAIQAHGPLPRLHRMSFAPLRGE